MENKTFQIELTCLFCDAPLEENNEKEPCSGDLIQCQNCKEMNDYDSLVEVAKEKGEKVVHDYAVSEIDKMLKKHFK